MSDTKEKASRIRRLEWAIAQNTGHFATDMMLVRLASFANDWGLVRMQVREIADKLGCSRAGIGCKIRRLIDLGLVKVERDGTCHKEHFYRLVLDAVADERWPSKPIRRYAKKENTDA